MGDRKRMAFEDWFDAEASASPVLLVLEDLHWGDLPTVGLCDAALRLYADRPLLVIGFGRPEVDELFPRMWRERDVQPMFFRSHP